MPALFPIQGVQVREQVRQAAGEGRQVRVRQPAQGQGQVEGLHFRNELNGVDRDGAAQTIFSASISVRLKTFFIISQKAKISKNVRNKNNIMSLPR